MTSNPRVNHFVPWGYKIDSAYTTYALQIGQAYMK